MIKPRKRWLTLSEAESLVGGGQDAREAILEGCRAGEIIARVKVPFGSGYRQIDPIDFEEAELNWIYSTIEYFMTKTRSVTKLELNHESLVQYFGLGEQQRKHTHTRKLGGRPRTYDWEEFLIELGVHVHVHGLPDKQADLVERMMQWCTETWGCEPALSEAKKRVSTFWNAVSERLKT